MYTRSGLLGTYRPASAEKQREKEREREPQNTSLLIISDADGNGKINVGIFDGVTVQRRVSLRRSSRHRCAVGQRSKCGLIGRVSAARCHPPMASFVSAPLLADVWWVHTYTHLMVNMQCGGKKREREREMMAGRVHKGEKRLMGIYRGR